MLRSMTGAIVAAAAFGGLALEATPAAALPIFDTAPAAMTQAAALGAVEEVRLVCGPFGCYRRHPFYRPFYPVYGPRPYYGWRRPYYGWHRPYWGWHRRYHGWHRW